MPQPQTFIVVAIIVVLAVAIWKHIGDNNKPRGGSGGNAGNDQNAPK